MKRDIYKNLLNWKSAAVRKPLVLNGARQVGKTYILKDFGNREYESVIYLNFEEDPELAQFFSRSLKPASILENLSLYLKQTIKPQATLIIFDEIQECSEALNSLKYFNEQANEMHIIAAGSLLGIKLAHDKGFPVGQVDFLDLYPLTFFEFLDAVDEIELRKYLERIKALDPIAEPIHQKLIDYLKLYMFIGGMPEAVQNYLSKRDLLGIRKIHQAILRAYLLDFAKHAPAQQVMKITEIWDSIPYQLAKENKKFIFSAISGSARAHSYETAIQWLVDAGLIYKVYNSRVPKIPLSGYCDKKAFKVFLLDVGLLGAMNRMEPDVIVSENKLFTEYKGAFTENLAVQELMPQFEELYYWSSSGIAEVDFILQHEGNILPLEVKAWISKRKKSLLVYEEKYHPPVLLRSSLMNLKHDGAVYNYPLYLLGMLSNFSY
ncbi:MAG: ATP-binding protein [Gammaproteobacteria bacterium]|nr:ATP-binding protein [Gammaproteobacteria bacterium]